MMTLHDAQSKKSVPKLKLIVQRTFLDFDFDLIFK